mmetsp:Transcript_58865/g.120443  ORF Transcript_58865/g.120443 Transcript_58865/m.120443 type:complete len:789 (+) Transcript_58865:2134-4500(+)
MPAVPLGAALADFLAARLGKRAHRPVVVLEQRAGRAVLRQRRCPLGIGAGDEAEDATQVAFVVAVHAHCVPGVVHVGLEVAAVVMLVVLVLAGLGLVRLGLALVVVEQQLHVARHLGLVLVVPRVAVLAAHRVVDVVVEVFPQRAVVGVSASTLLLTREHRLGLLVFDLRRPVRDLVVVARDQLSTPRLPPVDLDLVLLVRVGRRMEAPLPLARVLDVPPDPPQHAVPRAAVTVPPTAPLVCTSPAPLEHFPVVAHAPHVVVPHAAPPPAYAVFGHTPTLRAVFVTPHPPPVTAAPLLALPALGSAVATPVLAPALPPATPVAALAASSTSGFDLAAEGMPVVLEVLHHVPVVDHGDAGRACARRGASPQAVRTHAVEPHCATVRGDDAAAPPHHEPPVVVVAARAGRELLLLLLVQPHVVPEGVEDDVALMIHGVQDRPPLLRTVLGAEEEADLHPPLLPGRAPGAAGVVARFRGGHAAVCLRGACCLVQLRVPVAQPALVRGVPRLTRGLVFLDARVRCSVRVGVPLEVAAPAAVEANDPRVPLVRAPAVPPPVVVRAPPPLVLHTARAHPPLPVRGCSLELGEVLGPACVDARDIVLVLAAHHGVLPHAAAVAVHLPLLARAPRRAEALEPPRGAAEFAFPVPVAFAGPVLLVALVDLAEARGLRLVQVRNLAVHLNLLLADLLVLRRRLARPPSHLAEEVRVRAVDAQHAAAVVPHPPVRAVETLRARRLLVAAARPVLVLLVVESQKRLHLVGDLAKRSIVVGTLARGLPKCPHPVPVASSEF